jgi:pentapeptide MXKDX repeat protein
LGTAAVERLAAERELTYALSVRAADADAIFQPRKSLAVGQIYAHLRRSRRKFQGRAQSRTAFSIEESAPMTSKLKFLVHAAACLAIGGVAFANVARAEDAPAKPDAMTADHMSGDHMAPMKKTHMKKHMMKGDHMMAPETPK